MDPDDAAKFFTYFASSKLFYVWLRRNFPLELRAQAFFPKTTELEKKFVKMNPPSTRTLI